MAITAHILKQIELKNYSDFENSWFHLKDKLTEREKQELLTEIVGYYYSDKHFPFFKKVLDKIIDSKVSLDFSIEHYAPTFLSLAVHVVSQQLFAYLLQQGASINFIGDCYAFETEETIKKEVGDNLHLRYSTCLDFAELVMADTLTVDYNYSVPEKIEDITWHEIDNKEEIKVKKKEYYYLLEQSQYLHDLIHTDRLVDHIKSLGGKTYLQLKGK